MLQFSKLFPIITLLFVPHLTLAATVIDLTHPFNRQTITWPTSTGFEIEKRGWQLTDKGYFYAANIIKLPEHTGTHMDAPIHFAKDGWTVEKIPLVHLFGDAAVIDVSGKVGNKADTLILKEDIVAWEARHGTLGQNDIVLFYTGWEKFWGDKKKYLGSDKFGDTANLHFPGLAAAAAIYLKSKKVKGVGLDTASLDDGQSGDFMAHRILLGANIYGLENLANIKQLPARGARLIVAPMKIEQGTGGPVRVFAEIGE